MNENTRLVDVAKEALQDKRTHAEIIRVLQSSIYPGAKPESIELVLSYCRINGLDPMLRPIHIVPQSIKLPNGRWETRDVLMPGIADYRIKASRTGEYVGKSEPEFGPDVLTELGGVKVTYPQWCRITVSRWVKDGVREFPAKEYWLENYATAARDSEAPNRMWLKRAYGQLAKCTEAQALRMAFPEFSGGAPTAEEMEGKTDQPFTGSTIDARPEPSREEEAPPGDARATLNVSIPLKDKPQTFASWFTALELDLAQAQSVTGVDLIHAREKVQAVLAAADEGKVQADRAAKVRAAIDAAHERVFQAPATVPTDDSGWPSQDEEKAILDAEAS